MSLSSYVLAIAAFIACYGLTREGGFETFPAAYASADGLSIDCKGTGLGTPLAKGCPRLEHSIVLAAELPEALQTNLDKTKGEYQQAIASANMKLLDSFDAEISRIRKDTVLKPEAKKAAIDAVEAEKATFERFGAIPFSPRLRTPALNYLKAIRQAERPAATAYDKAIDYLIKTKKDDAGASELIADKKKVLKARIVGTWKCTGGNFKGDFTWTMYANGSGGGAISWTLDKEKLVFINRAPNSPPGGWIDTCILDDKGQSFTAKNQRGGTYTGKRIDPPQE